MMRLVEEPKKSARATTERRAACVGGKGVLKVTTRPVPLPSRAGLDSRVAPALRSI